jgi:hypothetical protein
MNTLYISKYYYCTSNEKRREKRRETTVETLLIHARLKTNNCPRPDPFDDHEAQEKARKRQGKAAKHKQKA